MKKINIEQIKKINTVLILIIASFVIISFSVKTIKGMIPRKHPKNAQMKIINSEDEKEVEKIKESIDFYKKLDDVYVFSISTTALKSDELSDDIFSNSGVSNALGQSMGYSSFKLINFLFVKNGKTTSLFSSKVFIYKHKLRDLKEFRPLPPDDDYSYYLSDHDFNIYAVVKSDTNNDKTLDSKDNISLYISDYDGNNLQEISSSIYYFKCTGRNFFVFSEYEDGKVSFYEYDGNLKKVSLIKTFEKELTEKRIEMW